MPIYIMITYAVWAWQAGEIFAFSIDLLRHPYNTIALPCECVIPK